MLLLVSGLLSQHQLLRQSLLVSRELGQSHSTPSTKYQLATRPMSEQRTFRFRFWLLFFFPKPFFLPFLEVFVMSIPCFVCFQQLVDKDPEKAIPLFWAAINAGDRVDSALKDMAIVMKQQNRAEEAIEAIKSLRNRCSDQAQESLDNILLDLYKVSKNNCISAISFFFFFFLVISNS